MASTDGDIARLVGEPRTCLVRESAEHQGVFEILSPAVGLFDLPPAVGTFLRPGSFAGYLTVMRRYFHLMIPEGHTGVVTHLHVKTRKQRVEYGQPLFTVSPESISVAGLAPDRQGSTGGAADQDVPEGMFAVRSPTDGIFYRRANPQSPSYVEEGAVVTQGTVLALVEVMKCFNPIVYAGEPEFPPKGRVAKIIARDTTEVKHGALLLLIEPA